MTPRKKEFRLLTMHGVVRPRARSKARLRNDLYMVGAVKLMYSQKLHVDVRLIGYEVPLQSGKPRGKCIDLFGYDAEHNPYIIELKTGGSKKRLPNVIQQINDYESMLIPLLGDIEKEIKEKLFLDEFKLKRNVKKIILASREYYEENPWKPFKKGDILFCYFHGKQNVDKIVEKATGETIVSLSIHNKP
ncbi:MAG: hypothetical protein ABFC98_07695 [Candidatus Cloacimonas sp.]